jgi:hypothetical protein
LVNVTFTVLLPLGKADPSGEVMDVLVLLMSVVLLTWQVSQVNGPYFPPVTPQPPLAFHLLEPVVEELWSRFADDAAGV